MDSRVYFLFIPNFKNDNADKQCAWGVRGEAGPPYHPFKKAAGNTNEQQRETIEIIEHVLVVAVYSEKEGRPYPGSPYLHTDGSIPPPHFPKQHFCWRVLYNPS